MGQRLEITSRARLGETTLIATDRSLTGQEANSFDRAPADTVDPPSHLAASAFDSIPGIRHLHVASNTVVVHHPNGWSAEQQARLEAIIGSLFVAPRIEPERLDEDHLRQTHYNATVVDIRRHNENLWIMGVSADDPPSGYVPGQYATLGLGYWEGRADDAIENLSPDARRKMIRRSYSVSSSIVDGAPTPSATPTESIEFYIVRVPSTEDQIPALTPRIFALEEGSRIYLGRKFAGRYTLEGVQDDDSVVFLATGTGEAPHNTMIEELLRRGHEGPIVSVVCVRFRSDLAYEDAHSAVAERHPNYQYVALTTREPPPAKKTYIQDLITSGRLDALVGRPLDSANTHFFLCGNPAMIGLPDWAEDGKPHFPAPTGVCELLYKRGFTIDHRRQRGNVHYEEYW